MPLRWVVVVSRRVTRVRRVVSVSSSGGARCGAASKLRGAERNRARPFLVADDGTMFVRNDSSKRDYGNPIAEAGGGTLTFFLTELNKR